MPSRIQNPPTVFILIAFDLCSIIKFSITA
jgi:hypothetical protein